MGIIQSKLMSKRRARAEKRIDFASFYGGIRTDVVASILPIKYATKTYNFCFKNGALTTGLGISPLTFLSYKTKKAEEVKWKFSYEPERLYLFRAYNGVTGGVGDRLIAYHNGGNTGTGSGKLVWAMTNTNIGQYMTIPKLGLYEAPMCSVNYTDTEHGDAFIFGSSMDGLKLWSPRQNNPTSISSAPLVTSLCVHFERVFATVWEKGNHIWFSEALEPTKWDATADDAGYIVLNDKLSGGANKIISFNNYLYVIRDYGITRITAFASQDSFSVQHIYSSSNLIRENTLCRCGDLIYFLQTDGLYAFDGVNVKKIETGFEGLILGQNLKNARATFYKGKYCIILNSTLSDEVKDDYNNTLICYDIKSGEYDIMCGIFFRDILGVISGEVERLVAIINTGEEGAKSQIVQVDESGQVGGVATKKYWESAFTDLGYSDYEKCITRLSLQTKYDCKVILETEKESKEIVFKGGDVVQSKSVNLRGVMFKVKFVAETVECEISHPEITFNLGKPNVCD